MKELNENILSKGRCTGPGILKVDSFINHQMDPFLMQRMAMEIARRFESERIDKVITVEASGIAPAIMTGLCLGVPVVFAKKNRPSTMGDSYVAEVFSFTKNRTYTICVSREFLSRGERILFVDDFLANGNAALGIADIAGQAGAVVCGMAFLIEKGFQDGHRKLEDMGFRVESLAKVLSLENGEIVLEQ